MSTAAGVSNPVSEVLKRKLMMEMGSEITTASTMSCAQLASACEIAPGSVINTITGSTVSSIQAIRSNASGVIRFSVSPQSCNVTNTYEHTLKGYLTVRNLYVQVTGFDQYSYPTDYGLSTEIKSTPGDLRTKKDFKPASTAPRADPLATSEPNFGVINFWLGFENGWSMFRDMRILSGSRTVYSSDGLARPIMAFLNSTLTDEALLSQTTCTSLPQIVSGENKGCGVIVSITAADRVGDIYGLFKVPDFNIPLNLEFPLGNPIWAQLPWLMHEAYQENVDIELEFENILSCLSYCVLSPKVRGAKGYTPREITPIDRSQICSVEYFTSIAKRIDEADLAVIGVAGDDVAPADGPAIIGAYLNDASTRLGSCGQTFKVRLGRSLKADGSATAHSDITPDLYSWEGSGTNGVRLEELYLHKVEGNLIDLESHLNSVSQAASQRIALPLQICDVQLATMTMETSTRQIQFSSLPPNIHICGLLLNSHRYNIFYRDDLRATGYEILYSGTPLYPLRDNATTDVRTLSRMEEALFLDMEGINTPWKLSMDPYLPGMRSDSNPYGEDWIVEDGNTYRGNLLGSTLETDVYHSWMYCWSFSMDSTYGTGYNSSWAPPQSARGYLQNRTIIIRWADYADSTPLSVPKGKFGSVNPRTISGVLPYLVMQTDKSLPLTINQGKISFNTISDALI